MTAPNQNPFEFEREWKHGSTIKNGIVRLTSVSALNLADASTSTGCARKYKYRYREDGEKLKEPETDSKKEGKKGHAGVAWYLVSGERSHLTSRILSGLHQLPPPGPDLLVEHDLIPDLPDGSSGLEQARIRVAGIPLTGAIDLAHARPENYGVHDVRESIDPEGVIKLVDHKFISDVKSAKTGPELLKELQMALYGVWAFDQYPDLDRVRLSHNYFPAKGTPRVATVLARREQLEPAWKRAGHVAVSMQHAAAEPDIDRIDANLKACTAYGRDCPAIAVCTAAKKKSFSYQASQLVSQLAGHVRLHVIQPHVPTVLGAPPDMTHVAGSLMDRLKQQAAMSAASNPVPVAAPPLQAPPAPAYVPAPVNPQIANAMAGFAAQEAAVAGTAPAYVAPPSPVTMATIAQHPQVPVVAIGTSSQGAYAPTQVPVAPSPVVELVATDEQMMMINQIVEIGKPYGIGYPGFIGDAATAIARKQNIQLGPEREFLGKDQLAGFKVPDLALLPKILEEVIMMAQRAAAQFTQAQQVHTPPAVPIAPTAPIAPQVSVQPIQVPPPPASLQAPEVPPPPAPPTMPTPPPSEEDKKKAAAEKRAATKAAKKKAEEEAAAKAPPTAADPAPAQTTPPLVVAATTDQSQRAPDPAPTTGPVNLFVDQWQVEGMPTQSLWPIVDGIVKWMGDQARMEENRRREAAGEERLPEGQPFHFLNGDPDGMFGFGRWKGIVDSCLNATPIASGNWTIDTRTEIGAIVAESMRAIVRKSGGVMVRGQRN